MSGTSFAAAWPLTGREDELRTLAQTLTGRRPRSVVLVGPAGVGKTRLAREALAIADKAGRATRWVTATHSVARTPLGAFATLLPAADATGADTLQDLLRRYAAEVV